MQTGRFSAIDLGAITVTTLADGSRTLPLSEGFILNAGTSEINAALAEAGMPPDELKILFNPIVITTAEHRVLIDTGNGPQPPGSTAGHLMESLAAASIAPDSIDLVVISHFHGDHVNGLLNAAGAAAFPNAAITVPRVEWDFWMSDAEASRATPGRMTQLFQANRKIFSALTQTVTQYEWGTDIIPGLAAIGTPGHSIGHTSFMVTGTAKELFVQSDLTNNPALFVRHPGWHAGFDQDPVLAEATRRKTLAMLADENTLVQGFHFPFPSRGTIAADGDGFRYIPVG
jgi:glyoxylase-like metal-dependent hydrolase (beta-lactamase superfamily II)